MATTMHTSSDAPIFESANGKAVPDDEALQAMRKEVSAQEAAIREAKRGVTEKKNDIRGRKLALADAEREIKGLEEASNEAGEAGVAMIPEIVRAFRSRYQLGDSMIGSLRDETFDGVKQTLQGVHKELAEEEDVLRKRKAEVLDQEMSFRYRRGVLEEMKEELTVLAGLKEAQADGEMSAEDLKRYRAAEAKLLTLEESFADMQGEVNPRKQQMARMVRSGSNQSLKSVSSWASMASTEEDTRSEEEKTLVKAPIKAAGGDMLSTIRLYLIIATWLAIFYKYFMEGEIVFSGSSAFKFW